MYAEEIPGLSKKYGFDQLYFKHPDEDEFLHLIAPESKPPTNIILTGTAGDGKTTLCYALWEHLGGQIDDLKSHYQVLELPTPDGNVTVHFLFDLSSWAPERGQPWPSEKIELLNCFARSVNGEGRDIFVIAANDGKLVQIWQGLCEFQPDSPAAELRNSLDFMLATNLPSISGKRLSLINLSRTNTASVLRLAISSLVERPEWDCFSKFSEDAAYGPQSPLYQNWCLLKDELFCERLCVLMDLCEANGFHIPIREIYLLLINTLLGHPHAAQNLMKASDVRKIVAEGSEALAGAHRNFFGDNLPQQKRSEYRVFGYLSLFRIGEETSNEIDNLILFGKYIPELYDDYSRFFESYPQFTANERFERLRADYLSAEDFDEEKRDAFLAELANERRRLFFRLVDSDSERIQPWQLTVFQSAGKFQRCVVNPLRTSQPVNIALIESLIKGLNRAWSGMLIDEGAYLHLTSGLDFTTARLSPISLHKIPASRNFYGEQVTVEFNSNKRPSLIVHFLDQRVEYELTLLRFEFLERISQGTLPNSFSRECYEDVIAFKSRLLAAWQQKSNQDQPSQLRIVELDDRGIPNEYIINL